MRLHAPRRRGAWLSLAAVLLGHVHSAGAEERDPAAIERSASLFREGRFLLNKGRFEEACEKFRASLELHRTPGTLLNVANCQESSGDPAAALESVEAALSLAAREPDRRKSAGWMAAARDEIAALEPRVAVLTVHSSTEPPPAVTLDGLPLNKFDVPLRLNPGHHNLEAAAPRRRPFGQELELAAGKAETVVIPELELDTPAPTVAEPPPVARLEPPAPLPAAPPPAPTVPEPAPEPSRLLPWSLVGIGGALLAGGAITGGVAAAQVSDLKRDCPGKVCENDLSQRDHARTTALVADVLMGAGVVGIGVGVTLLVTGSSESAPQVQVACGAASCAGLWRGEF